MSEIKIGSFYLWTKGISARQVLGLCGDDVLYRDFNFDSGEPYTTHSVCSLRHFKLGVQRELSEEEGCRMNTSESDRLFRADEDKLISIALAKVSDKVLMEEVRRRELV